ncbi:MAG: tetratricopeptide repeat protein [Chlamydiia bacterium]|nr:tetratricopeptide repeat protein [Chlamydiia bacterium]
MKRLLIPFLIFLSLHALTSTETLLQSAEQAYHKGEKAKNLAERELAFNTALKHYLQLEKTYHPNFGNGKLYYNLGNTYFQLENYPRALYAYTLAHKLDPYTPRIEQSLKTTLKKLDLPDTPSPFYEQLPLTRLLQIYALLLLITFLCLSLTIWKKLPRLPSLLSLTLFCLFSLFWLIRFYFIPLEALLITSSPLYRDAGTEYTTLTTLPPGASIRVLSLKNNGTWAHVTTPDNTRGYLPTDTFLLFP